MGCAVTKPCEEEIDESVVSLCKERKKLIKSAVETRYLLAGTHCNYYQSLYTVALAIRLFVSRYSSVSSPFLITYPSQPKEENSMFFHHEANSCKRAQDSPVTKTSQESEMEEDEIGVVCEHFYDPPVEMQNGWDFFRLIDNGVVKDDFVGGFCQKQQVDKGLVVENGGKVRQGEEKVLKIDDKDGGGRELLEALKDVEDHFIRAYESGMEVSKMLETNMVHLQPSFEDIQDSPNNLIKSVTRTKSMLSRSTSIRSFLSSSSRSSLTWADFSTDIFDEDGAGGMESGSHSSTLGRLYAWEKKLYEEVKAGDELKKVFERKYSQLSKNNIKGDGCCPDDKTTAEVRDLYSRISVRLTSADAIYRRIQKLRDEELQPQLFEFLHGLIRTWNIMLEVHQTQKQTMSEVKYFACPALGKFSNDSHRLTTLQLGAAVQNWRACFTEYISAQKAYIEALNGWLSKLVALENESYPKDIFLTPHCQINVPQVLKICHHWLASMEKLPHKVVTHAMKSFGKNVKELWFQQGVEQQQRRRLDGLARDLDKRVFVYQKTEKKVLEMKLCEQKVEVDIRHRVETLEEKKDLLDGLRNRLDIEKAKHQDSIQETEKVILNGFQTGFSSVFASMVGFSKDSLKIYDRLLAHGELN